MSYKFRGWMRSYKHHTDFKPTSFDYLFKYGIAPCKSEYKKDKNYCGYQTKSGRIYILSPYSDEKTPSCMVDQYGFKCFSTGEFGSNEKLKKRLSKGWWESRDMRMKPEKYIDKSESIYNTINNREEDWGSIPF